MKQFFVVEVVRYRVKAESEEEACERITNDVDRDVRVVEVDDRYAYPATGREKPPPRKTRF